jgi:E3 ubiquitin-protein ligase TRIP12
MRAHGQRRSVLDVAFHGERGFGLGVTAEWYSLVATKLQCPLENVLVPMWQMDDDGNADSGAEETETKPALVMRGGLFPAVLDASHGVEGGGAETAAAVLRRFHLLGQLVAKALQDRRVLPIVLSKAFLKAVTRRPVLLSDLAEIDALGSVPAFLLRMRHLASRQAAACPNDSVAAAADAAQVRKAVAEEIPMACYFVVPTAPHLELHPGGLEEEVTVASLARYVDLASHWVLERGLQPPADAFRRGLVSVAPAALDLLMVFTPGEQQRLIAGDADVLWDPSAEAEKDPRRRVDKEAATLQALLVPQHGYTRESPPLRLLCRALARMGPMERRRFLTFATGCPHLPPGGLAAMQPPLTVMRRSDSDQDLTTTSTCFRCVCLPLKNISYINMTLPRVLVPGAVCSLKATHNHSKPVRAWALTLLPLLVDALLWHFLWNKPF